MADEVKTTEVKKDVVQGTTTTAAPSVGVAKPAEPLTKTTEQKKKEPVLDRAGNEIKPNFKSKSQPSTVAPRISSDEKAKQKEEIHNKIEAIVKEYGGKETDIPLGHDYWNLVNQYRGMD